MFKELFEANPIIDLWTGVRQSLRKVDVLVEIDKHNKIQLYAGLNKGKPEMMKAIKALRVDGWDIPMTAIFGSKDEAYLVLSPDMKKA